MDTWPIETLWPSSVRWSSTYMIKDGGTTLNGDENPVVSDGGGRWACEMTVPLVDYGGVTAAQRIKLARAMIESTFGGAVPMIVPYIASAEAPWPVTGLPEFDLFDDGSAFDDTATVETDGIIVTAAAASLRASQLTITPVAMAALIAGECFSIDHATQGRRLYPVTRVSGGVITLGRLLREAITDGTVLDFARPGCVMRLKNAADALAAVTPPYVSSLTLQFQESRIV